MKLITFLMIVGFNLSTSAVDPSGLKEHLPGGSKDIWITHTLDTYGTTSNTTMELDIDGNPHICYRGSADPNLIHASYNGLVWNYEIVEDSPGLAPAMLLDAWDNPHACYFGVPNGGLFYIHKAASVWNKELALPEPISGDFPSIVLDPDGNPHISFYDTAGENLKHCWRSESGWQVETVDEEGESGQYSSMAVNNQGILQISYLTTIGPLWWNTYLKYAQKDETGWQIEILDVEDAPGFYTSIATDSNGFPHIVYERDFHGDDPLRYIWKDENGWHSELIDLANDTWADCNELTLDDNDVPHVTYWDDHHFKYAYRDEMGWNIEIIDEFGISPSIAVDACGFPHITYSNYTENLIYTKKALDPTPTPECFHHGDVNFTGTLSAGDAQLAFGITLGTITPTSQEECAADCDGNGTVTANDTQMIFNAIFGGSCIDPIS